MSHWHIRGIKAIFELWLVNLSTNVFRRHAARAESHFLLQSTEAHDAKKRHSVILRHCRAFTIVKREKSVALSRGTSWAALSDANLHRYDDLPILLVAGGVNGIKGDSISNIPSGLR
jgi:hypothetical protein